MGKFKIGDKVVWVVENGNSYYGEVTDVHGLNITYPVLVILEKTGDLYTFTENGTYDNTNSRTTYIRHLTKLEQVLR